MLEGFRRDANSDRGIALSHMSALQHLQDWYYAQCNGDWEHSYGISISNLDNPGWSLDIDLAETDLEGKVYEELRRDYDHPTDWLICYTRDEQFQARCGPLMLESAIELFLAWAKSEQ